ncbi:hypothetical protein QYM36_019158 [Artemia franciscana]|uniref:J domain-containing protein n=1 Tax=Artemia franciscana TaxID=6661 RepID=A0AA88H7P9_ARTSF|nr:hypothetical protein QYM36_019158 [Artemia franciscana]
MPGYCVQGTVGTQVLGGAKKIEIENRQTVEVKLSVEYMSFSAHADAKGIMQLIQYCQPKNVLLVHGEGKKMDFLKKQIQTELGIDCFMPANGETAVIKTALPVRAVIDQGLLMKSKQKYEMNPPDPKRPCLVHGVLVVKDDKKRIEAKKTDYYTVLKLNRKKMTGMKAKEIKAEIRKSYRFLAMRWHPDKNRNNEKEATNRFQEILKAYEVLVDDEKQAKKTDYYTMLKLNRKKMTGMKAKEIKAEVRKSYRFLAMRWHPDKNRNNEKEATSRFQEILKAYEVLVDDEKRNSVSPEHHPGFEYLQYL